MHKYEWVNEWMNEGTNLSSSAQVTVSDILLAGALSELDLVLKSKQERIWKEEKDKALPSGDLKDSN